MPTSKAPRFDIISIGTLSRNRLWNESEAVRTAHATTTLVRAGRRNILIDPGLPAPALAARLFERTGLMPDGIDTVFLTNFRPSHRGGLTLFPKAKKLIHPQERQTARAQIEALLRQAPEEDLDHHFMEHELELLNSLAAPEDKLADGVDLFPLFGYTPGNCGLLISLPTVTVLIAGDAVATQEHFLAGQVLPDTQDIEAAQRSLQEVYEIADIIVPGHDNVFLSPRAAGM